MSQSDREALLAALSGDVDARARAIQGLHRFELVDRDVFGAVLRACRDTAALPDVLQPTVEADPFAGFFGGTGAPAKKTVAELAAQKLAEVGWPGLLPSAEVAVEVLAEGPSELLVAHCAEQLGATEWEDRQAALTLLVPALHAQDAAMYPVIVRADDKTIAVMVKSALDPYRSRATNELLANGNSHEAMLKALCASVITGTLVPDEQQAMGILAQIVTWAPDKAPGVAEALEPRFPWAVTFAAFDDVAARERMAIWLATNPSFPGSLPARLDEALRSRAPIEGFPLVPWLRACDGSATVIAAWKATAAAAPLLQTWVTAADVDRACESALLLGEVGLHEPVGAAIAALVANPEASWDGAGLRAVASFRPPLPGIGAALAAVLGRNPDRAAEIVPALLAAEPGEDVLRSAAIAAVAHAEAAPIKKAPMRRGGTRTVREGTDAPALKPLIDAVGDPELTARHEAVLPYLGA